MMDKLMELIRGKAYLVHVAASAIIAVVVISQLSGDRNVKETFMYWAICFLLLLVVGLGVKIFFAKKRRQVEKSLGIENIYLDRGVYDELRPKLFSNAERIRLHSIYANFSYEGLEDLVKTALKSGKLVEVLIADPLSTYVQGDDSLQLGVMGEDTPKKIEKDIEIFRKIEAERQIERWVGSLVVRMHRQQPMWSIVVFDDIMFAAPYLYRIEGLDTFCLRARRRSSGRSTFGQLWRHVNLLWEVESAPLDMADGDTQRPPATDG